MEIQRTSIGLIPVLALTVVSIACGGGNKDGTTAAKAEVSPSGPVAVDSPPPPVEPPVRAGSSTGTEPGVVVPGAAGSSGSGSAAANDSSGEGRDSAVPDDPQGTPEAEDTGDKDTETGPNPAALLKELRSRRTKDARAAAIVTELEAAGTKPTDIAIALTERGKALHASPDRAKVFYEQASQKDPKYPNPAFELARQAAVLGELGDAKRWLKVVHERKGKKLLKQIEFDPMWEILKDDPEVRALLR